MTFDYEFFMHFQKYKCCNSRDECICHAIVHLTSINSSAKIRGIKFATIILQY